MDAIERLKRTIEGKVDDYEIYISRERIMTIEVKDGAIDSFEKSMTEGAALRVLKDKSIGFSFSSCLLEDSLKEMAKDAIDSAIYTAGDEFYGFPLKEAIPPLELKVYDPYLIHCPEREKIDKVLSLEDSARSYDPKVKKTRKAYYREILKEVEIIGKDRINSHLSTRVTSGILAVAEGDGDSQIGWDSEYKRFFSDLNPVEIGRSAAERAVRLLGARQGKTASLPAILENTVSAEFLEVLSSSFLADNLHKGKSMLKDKIDKKVFSSLITIVDDGLLTGGWATAPFDDEGVKRQTTYLVKDGMLIGYLYDHYWAKRGGKDSTGNCYRQGFKTPPQVSYTNLYINKGSLPFQALIKEIRQGIYITDLLGIHTANRVTGDFSLGAMGFWIDNGNIAYPVKGIAISGNLLDLFSKVVGVGDDLRFFGGIGSPSLLVEELDISGR